MCSRTQKLTVVLASASPRRTELLEQGNIKHVVMPSHCEGSNYIPGSKPGCGRTFCTESRRCLSAVWKRKIQEIFW